MLYPLAFGLPATVPCNADRNALLPLLATPKIVNLWTGFCKIGFEATKQTLGKLTKGIPHDMKTYQKMHPTILQNQ